MATSSPPRKRKLDALFEESGIDMTTALSLLPPELDGEGGTMSDTSLETSTFPFNQDTISQNHWGPQQDTIDLLIDACMAPLARIRDDLIRLYFHHVHPVCPVVDEYSFTTLYGLAKTDGELLSYIELPLLQAMLFTALAHVSQDQLDRTPYSSIHDAQKAHFNFTRALYRFQVCTKPYVLAQVTILLTFWSPCDTELQVNSFWLDRAYRHAREAAIWNIQTSAGSPGDRRAIIWWCCLIRDRMLATGMRRPHRLHQVQNVRGMLKEEDFGLEALLPSYSSREAKKRMIAVFLAFCRLSEIQADIAEYQSRFRFSRQWEIATTPGISETEEMPTVAKFETRLKEWKRVFEEECRMVGTHVGDNTYASTVCLIRLISKYVLLHANIFRQFTFANKHSGLLLILYQPYLQWWSSAPFEAKNLWELSLRKLKEGTQQVVSSVRQLITTSTAPLETVPAFM
ncbi:uncharacterized protein PV07_04409 [Cladophialophora immunda]|uniref:Xylanolytic transcriptional activator regulatory domain-containing protein n=1 Tax=Cladophialophora immunda TaxID=569365 RepID=A0A0D1ZXP5_9EURO|nr:uncharacterized protein PV07_04409 [Cladophialophora immunda]KIW32896.1 hypothetical protein PV07_04409 [Cladophialophora immunda]